MPTPPRVYDLMLVLSTAAEDDRRAKILEAVATQIADAGGKVERQDDWHTRTMAYEIDHQGEGEYHLLQLTGPTELLESLSHNLRIDDAVLRFRIIRVLPGTPPAPDPPPAALAGAAASGAPAPAEAPIER
ncbi:MAG: 30S ribosomal protein S6 [Solirubrobacteraceae bacterium]